MPLPPSVERDEIHQRVISMKAYHRKDGLFDIEAHLRDTKPFDFDRVGREDPLPAGQSQHDLWLRLVIDADHVIHAIETASDTTPFGICPQAGASLKALVGARIGKGWGKIVRERLERVDNCTHLVEMLTPLATVSLMGTRGVRTLEDRFPPGAAPKELDSCYAWSVERAEVLRMFPSHHRERRDA